MYSCCGNCDGGHYNQQLRVLSNQYDAVEKTAQTSEELTELKNQISEFRDDELEHLNTALDHDAEKAVPYMLITEGIKLICRGAIWTAERI
ncbi:Ubiquinone biosynthesis protein COQ7 family protein [Candida albicans]|uniref:Ubiquinone biosynthesis protein COQ7 family protein n=1 Tax=Candida albicans TaxID=5476 RepID=A0A8H6BTZ3_CANAX|nr:Ubiquinone biosynthesis protein COQ7 family protein [Candida albicans]